MEMKELLQEFIDWAAGCGEDAFYVFDESEQAITRFLAQREQL